MKKRKAKAVKAGVASYFCLKCGKALTYTEWLHGRLCGECEKEVCE